MASVIIKNDLTINVFVNSTRLLKCIYSHLMSSDKICQVTEVCNIPGFCKSMSIDFKSSNISSHICLILAVSALNYFERCNEREIYDADIISI